MPSCRGSVVHDRLFDVLSAESFDPDDPLHGFFVERYALARQWWRAVLVAEQEAGRARHDIDVDRLSTEVLGVLLGIEHQWLMDADRVDIVAVALGYLDRLRDSIAPDPPPRFSFGHEGFLGKGSNRDKGAGRAGHEGGWMKRWPIMAVVLAARRGQRGVEPGDRRGASPASVYRAGRRARVALRHRGLHRSTVQRRERVHRRRRDP